MSEEINSGKASSRSVTYNRQMSDMIARLNTEYFPMSNKVNFSGICRKAVENEFKRVVGGTFSISKETLYLAVEDQGKRTGAAIEKIDLSYSKMVEEFACLKEEVEVLKKSEKENEQKLALTLNSMISVLQHISFQNSYNFLSIKRTIFQCFRPIMRALKLTPKEFDTYNSHATKDSIKEYEFIQNHLEEVNENPIEMLSQYSQVANKDFEANGSEV